MSLRRERMGGSKGSAHWSAALQESIRPLLGWSCLLKGAHICPNTEWRQAEGTARSVTPAPGQLRKGEGHKGPRGRFLPLPGGTEDLQETANPLRNLTESGNSSGARDGGGLVREELKE